MRVTPKLNSLFSLLFPPQCICCRGQIEPSDWRSDTDRDAVGPISGNTDGRGTLAGSLNDLEAQVDLDFAQHWCRDCWRQLPDFQEPACPTCGAFILRPAAFGDCCAVCIQSDFKFQQCVALGNYEGLLKQLVVGFKGNYDEPLSFQLGKLLGYQLERYDFLPSVDFLLPMPTHWRRRFKRGFHGAAVIAEGIKSTTRIPIQNGLMSCRKLTKKQGLLSEAQRFANVKGGFQLNRCASVDGATVLIVDDVMTSGATMSEAAGVLMKAGAANVYAAVVARGTRSR